jgi:hypothetical protein
LKVSHQGDTESSTAPSRQHNLQALRSGSPRWVKNDENTLRIDSLSIVEQRQGFKKPCMNIHRYRVDWILFFYIVCAWHTQFGAKKQLCHSSIHCRVSKKNCAKQ